MGDGKDFATEQEMMNVIDDVVTNGTINESKSKWDKVTLEKDGMVVVIRKNVRDGNGNVVGNKNWVVTSFDNNIPKTKKQSPAATRATPDGNQGGRAVAPGDVSADKGNEKVPDGQKDSDYLKAHEGLEEPVRASEPEPTPEPAPEPRPEQQAAAKPEPLPRPEIPDVKPEDMTDEAIAAEIQALRDYDHHPATVEFDNELIARRDALLAEQQKRAQDSGQSEPEQGEKSTNTYRS